VNGRERNGIGMTSARTRDHTASRGSPTTGSP